MKKKSLLEHVLATEERDPGCDAGFGVLDLYVEAVLDGRDVGTLFPEIVTHMKQCAACREDTEGLLAVLRKNIAPDS